MHTHSVSIQVVPREPMGNVTGPQRLALADLLRGPAPFIPSKKHYCAGAGRAVIHTTTAVALRAREWARRDMEPLELTPEGRRRAVSLGDTARSASSAQAASRGEREDKC